MKLLVPLAIALAHAAEEVVDTADAGWKTSSDADTREWRNDVMHASNTMKQIKSKSCKPPPGRSLSRLGSPKQVSKHFYKLNNGNTRATYQFKFADGTVVYAGNANVGQKGGIWKIYCYRQGHNVATRGPHEQNDLDQKMIQKLRSAFKQADRDGSGTISTGGAYHALSMLFPTYTLPNFEDTLERESIRGAGKDKVVDLDEFECIAKKLYNIRKVYSEFRQYDKNHDLKMDRKELERALTQFYFKNVAKPGLIQTVMIRQQVKKTVDSIIKRHDKNHDQQVSWHEFEMDAFMEEHYNLGAKCHSSKTPLNRHEVSVVENLIRKFTRHGNKKQLSHSEWYQIASMLTEQEIDKANGAAKPPALGCRTTPEQENHQKHHGFGPGTKAKGRERVLLRRFLQQPKQTIKNRKFMNLMETLHELHKQADSNRDGHISDHEILDIFQGVRDHLSTSDFGSFLDMVNKIKGPVNCGKNKDCGRCTAAANAGLCGWFKESQRQNNNPFGGYMSKSKGICKFVDRGGRAQKVSNGEKKLTTCSKQCANKNLRKRIKK